MGIISFLSYTAAVVIAPLAYPGCDPMAQAVSDLSAANAPSLMLWNQLSALYNACEVVCVTVVCIGIQGQKTELLRSGVYLFAAMEWGTAVRYRMFPLSSNSLCRRVSGCYAHGHYCFGGGAVHRIADGYNHCRSKMQNLPFLWYLCHRRTHDDARRCARNEAVPAAYFGVVERFSVFAATGFNAALGIHLFCTKSKSE